MEQIGIGIVGFGYWGPKLLRNFYNAPLTQPVAVCEANEERREGGARNHPDLKFFGSMDEFLALETMDAVAISTPVSTHYALARAALEAGKHVFVEKPFTETSSQAAELIRLARERKLLLMVDHTFLYTAAVRKIKEVIDTGELGELLYFDSSRINLGLFQPDVDVIWDLAPHDLSILDYVIPRRPVAISATGASHVPSGRSDIAYVVLDFGENFIGHIHLNWLAPMKMRQILIGGSKKMITYNDVLPDEKIRIYNRGIEVQQSPQGPTITMDDKSGKYQTMISYRTGDVHVPWLDRTEALLRECSTFGEAVLKGKTYYNDALSGLRIVLMLEAASRSLKERGKFVEIEWHIYDELAGT